MGTVRLREENPAIGGVLYPVGRDEGSYRSMTPISARCKTARNHKDVGRLIIAP